MSYYVNKRLTVKEGTIDIPTGELQPDFGTVRVYCDKLNVDYNDKINVSTDSKESSIGVHIYRSDNTQIKNISLKTPSAQLTIDIEDASYIRIRFDDNTTQYKPSYAEFNSVIEMNEIEKLPQTATFTEVNQVNEKIYENLNLNKKCLGEILKQKGVNVLETDGTFDLINKVASIEDKKWAKGKSGSNFASNRLYIEVSNLDFKPSIVVIFPAESGKKGFCTYLDTSLTNMSYNYITAERSQNIWINPLSLPEYVKEGGFRLPIDTYVDSTYQTVFWYAYE